MKSPEQILKRIIILSAVSDLPHIMQNHSWSISERNDERDWIYNWLSTNNCTEEMTKDEIAFFHTSCDKATAEQLHTFSFSAEALRPLLWTLGLQKLTPCDDYDSSKDGFVTDILGIKLVDNEKYDIQKMLSNCKMRSVKEIDEQWAVAFLWHWRAIECNTVLKTGLTWIGEMKRIFSDNVVQLALKYIPHQKLRGDFLVKNVPVSKLTENKKYMLRKVTYWRHHAFEWVLGDEPWDEVSTDT